MNTDTFLYFAYGSNMSTRRLGARTPSAQLLGAAKVSGYRLVFDKSGRDGSAKADCHQTGNPTDQVLGALFRINTADRAALDRAEGAGHGYDAVDIVVFSNGAPHKVLTYIATDKRPGLTPYSWYIEHVLVGARELGLPADYVADIERVAVQADPLPQRHADELAIYSTD
jgi:hypothetical protein